MGYYYGPSGGEPPPEPKWWHKLGNYIPQGLKNWWWDMVEVSVITRVVFGVLAPVIGVMFAFVLFCVSAVLIFTWLAK